MVIQAERHANDRPGAPGQRIRVAGVHELHAHLAAGRAQLLAMFVGFQAALGPNGLAIAIDASLNLPLWELGHIGWFEEWWIRRNAGRDSGHLCDPFLTRIPSLLDGADGFYDSVQIAHSTRWKLSLPSAETALTYLAQVREKTLELLSNSSSGDDALYFFRLVLLHEDMHREAWFMMAQHLGIDLGVTLPNAFRLGDSAHSEHRPIGELAVAAGAYKTGALCTGFAFDNELSPQMQSLPAFSIDRSPVCWSQFLRFVEIGGYDHPNWWTPDGWQWRQQQSHGLPLHVRNHAGTWQQQFFGHWKTMDSEAPAVHLTAHEAAAWCRFAGRRLPTESEWETAVRQAMDTGESFSWGQVWEWTSSAFAPYDGFSPHPYREYSQPFFDGRPVLRGGSCATEPRMLHPAYRNYFGADRRDVFAGFRSCALD